MSNNQQRIIPDAPRMRSMAIMAPSAAPMVRASPLSQKAAPRVQTSTPEHIPTGWTPTSLAQVPSIYVLERTHIFVKDDVEKIASRISECLRKESIAATYRSDENVVDAETEGNVTFSIRLWAGTGKNSDKVLVEAQKTSGCCFMYCQAAKAVLRAAKGMGAVPKKRTFAIPSSIPRQPAEDKEAAAREGLEIASCLLKQHQIDAHMMAIESLMHLSQATENRAFTARCILCGEFRATLLSLIESFKMCEQDTAPDSSIEKENIAVMRRYSLTVMSNCLAALEQSGELADVLASEQDLTSKQFLTALVDEVGAAKQRPHGACKAAQCLKMFISASDDARRKTLDMGAAEAIIHARHMGVCRHAALEDACSQLRTYV